MKNHSITPRSAIAVTLLCMLALSGCASTPLPSEKLAVAEAAIARVSTESTSANAPAELQIAIAKLASAKQAVASKDYVLAGELAEQAAIDARVADQKSQAVQWQMAAQESQEAARVLREEINRNSVR